MKTLTFSGAVLALLMTLTQAGPAAAQGFDPFLLALLPQPTVAAPPCPDQFGLNAYPLAGAVNPFQAFLVSLGLAAPVASCRETIPASQQLNPGMSTR